MEAWLVMVLLIALAAWWLITTVNRGASKREIQPDYSAADIAINSKTGEIWMHNANKHRVVAKQDIQNYKHEWTEVNKGRRLYTQDHHIVFTIRDLKAPRFVVNFRTAEEARDWKERLDVFFSNY